MSDVTDISWTDHTFNPWWGCTKVSPACTNCYAESMATRWKRAEWGPKAQRLQLSEANWRKPLKWNQEAEVAQERRKVFCASMADVFEDRDDLREDRARLYRLINATPWLDWLLLTKRPEHVRKLTPASWLEAWPRNVWLGTTVENQEWADKRIPELIKSPAPVRFLSVEPMLGPVDLSQWAGLIDWAIVGGESGRKPRHMATEWVRDLRNQCVAMGIAFFFKQWGGTNRGNKQLARKDYVNPRKRKHLAVLDGQIWDQYPVYRWKREGAPMTVWEQLTSWEELDEAEAEAQKPTKTVKKAPPSEPSPLLKLLSDEFDESTNDVREAPKVERPKTSWHHKPCVFEGREMTRIQAAGIKAARKRQVNLANTGRIT